MKLEEIRFHAAQPIEGYGPGFFRIGGKIIKGPVLTWEQAACEWGGYDDINSLLALKDHIDVLLLGTGAEIAHAPAELRQNLEEAGIGVEVMHSPSACRTYNILLSEGRRVAAAVLPI